MTPEQRKDFIDHTRARSTWAFYNGRCYFFDAYNQEGKTPRLLVESWKAMLSNKGTIINATNGRGDYLDFRIDFMEQHPTVDACFTEMEKKPLFDGKTFPEVFDYLKIDDK